MKFTVNFGINTDNLFELDSRDDLSYYADDLHGYPIGC